MSTLRSESSPATGAGPQLIRSWIARAAHQTPERPYIVSVDDQKSITYLEFHRLVRQVGVFLRRLGVGTNDRVVMLANSSIEHLACYFGVLAYGATVCTIHVESNHRFLGRIVRLLVPRLILYEDGLVLDDVVAQAQAPCYALGAWHQDDGDGFFATVRRLQPADAYLTTTGERDDAGIFFTSGTSSWPKGVVQTYREMLSNVMATAVGFGVTADDRIYDFRSYNWASAQLLSALVPLYCGATLVMAKRFSSSRFFGHIRDCGATIAAGNPTTINMLLNSNTTADARNLPKLRFIISSSAPLLPEEWQRFEQRFGVRITQGYGSSETGWIAACPGETRVFGTVGRPLPYHKLAIVDGNGNRLPAGQVGAVELGGFEDNEYRYLDEDGVVTVNSRGRARTGDLGYLDADGFLHLTGREKELIIRGGVNISPVEIDSVLMRQPDVVEAAAIGVPDKIWGEEIVAYVVLRPGANIGVRDILGHCERHLPAFKAPKRIIIANDLPKTERGKLDRKALVAEWLRSR